MSILKLQLFVTVLVLSYYHEVLGYGHGSSNEESDSHEWQAAGGTEYPPEEHAQRHPNHGSPGSRDRDRDYGQSGQYGQNRPTQSSSSGYEANHFSRRTHVERYGVPKGCTVHKDIKKCNYFVEISKVQGEDNYLYFEVGRRLGRPSEGGYVAVGLSKDKFMGEDHIVECVKGEDDALPDWYASWSTIPATPTRLEHNRRHIQMVNRPIFENGTLVCKFKRPIVTRVEDPKGSIQEFDLVHGKYYILLSQGKIKQYDQLSYHGSADLGNTFVSDNLLGYQNDPYGYRGGSGYHPTTFISVAFFLLVACILL